MTRDQLENAYRHVLLHPDLALGDRLPVDPSTDEDFRFDTERTAFVPFGASDVVKLDSVALSVVEEVFAMPSDTLVSCVPSSPVGACTTHFVEGMLARAFRRPPTADEVNRYVALASSTANELGDPMKGLEFATASALASPWFLYLSETGVSDPIRGGEDSVRPLTGHELASRLAFFLWNEPPDAELSTAAEQGSLVEDDALRGHALRMLADERGRASMRRFFRQWFGYSDLTSIPKNTGVFPEFNPSLAAAMRTEVDAAVDAVVAGDPYPTLFTSTKAHLTPELASFYGVKLPRPDVSANGSTIVEAELPPERAGILTRAGILAVYGKPIDTSPTTRGLFVRQRLLCEIIPDPPPGVPTDLPPASDDIKTNRERVELHMTEPTCAACHQFVDPIGLALEHFDGIGKYRQNHDGFALDVTGNLDGVDFDGALELGSLLAEDPRIARCAVRQLSRFALGVEESGLQTKILDSIGDQLDASENWEDVVVSFVLSDLFRAVGPSREMGDS